MMFQYTPLITVLGAALLINTLSCCSAENVYCVTPTATSCSSCPHSTHCTTLSEYAQEAELYFTSNTTIVFLPGDHILDTNITVVNVSWLTLCGESSSGNRATVVCSGSVGLSFTGMVEFKIDSLAFTSCSQKYAIITNHPTTIQVGLYLKSTQDAGLENCSFHDNLGTALRLDNISISLAGNNEFTQNYVLCRGNPFGGGGIIAHNSILTFTGNTTFLDNTGNASCSLGGAIYMLYSIVSFQGINNFISNSAGADGGAISTFGTKLTFSGTSYFINNSAHGFGGAINTHNTTLTFSGTSYFINNSAQGYGGAIDTQNTKLIFSGTSNFINNSAQGYGGAIDTENTKLTFSGTSNFINNSAHGYGGAIYTQNTKLIFSGTSNFINNSADQSGGAIYTQDTTLIVKGASNFINNSAGGYGGAICTSYAILTFSGTNSFIKNSANYSGAIYTENAVLNFSGTSNFINNSASAIGANANSLLTLNGTIHFTNNGYYWGGISSGGGVYMGMKSTISFLSNTTVYWENNRALVGGAIYVEDSSPLSYCYQLAPYVPKQKCFFQLPGQNLSSGIDVKLVFKNNTADDAGSVLYAGAIDNCKLTHGLDSHSSGEVFDMIVHNNDSDYNTTSNISSDPIQVCQCENNLPNCSQRYVLCTVHPGETFHVSVVAVGQRNGTVFGEVMSNIDQTVNPGHLQDSQYLQETRTTCTQLNYTIFSLSQFVRMGLYIHSTRPMFMVW